MGWGFLIICNRALVRAGSHLTSGSKENLTPATALAPSPITAIIGILSPHGSLHLVKVESLLCLSSADW